MEILHTKNGFVKSSQKSFYGNFATSAH